MQSFHPPDLSLDTDPAMTTPAYTETSTTRFANVSVDGSAYRIHYNEIGSGEHVVVMLHGSGPGATGWANFNRNIDPFVAAGYRVLLIDCPGWGQSDPGQSCGQLSMLPGFNGCSFGYMEARLLAEARIMSPTYQDIRFLPQPLSSLAPRKRILFLPAPS